MEAYNINELKLVNTVARYIPNKKTGKLGVSAATCAGLIRNKKLNVKEVIIDGIRFIHVPLHDQVYKDWNMKVRLLRLPAGRPARLKFDDPD
jgi:hypothetical protein